LAVAAWTGTATALDPDVKCESAKLKEAGKYGFCRLKAESKGVKKGEAPDFTKCDEKYSFKWQKAETNAGSGVCPSEGDEVAIQAFITQHSDDLAVALAGGALPNCPGDLATCQSDLTTCDGDLTTCTGDLSTCNGDLTTCQSDLSQAQSDLTTCEGDLTTCESDLAAAELCGNGVVDGGEDCDQGDLDGETCVTQAFAGGTLACGAGCSFDTGGCYAARFVDNADGTITDNETGLTWEKKVELGGGVNLANPHDADITYVWSGTCSILTSKRCQPTAAAAALCAANSEAGTTGCDECTGGDGTCSATSTAWTLAADLNTADFAGASDWRVPRRDELVSIVDYFDTTFFPVTDVAFHGASCGIACTDITDPACSCTQSSLYWSASSLAPSPTTAAWGVDFFFGGVSNVSKTTGRYVRVVRGGS